jgi:phosphoribosylformylglycinamidine cyclo-ligase
MSKSYKEAGVDIEKGDLFVEEIKKKVGSRYHSRVVSGVGGFSCLYDIGKDKYLSAGVDGVGTKLLLAMELGIHHTIGLDLVAMCANDVICSGADPIFFMDYFACGSLDLEISKKVIEGIVAACDTCEMPLIGGETAEMPGLYHNKDYDLAGFCVGEVAKKDVLDGTRVRAGDVIIGVASSGLHSNGYSLARKLFKDEDKTFKELLLTPTKLYVPLIKHLKKNFSLDLHGLAHITGGGLGNIPRINGNFDYVLNAWPTMTELSSVFRALLEKISDPQDLFSTFNMGIGMVIVAPSSRAQDIIQEIESFDEKAFLLGKVISGKGESILSYGGKNYSF